LPTDYRAARATVSEALALLDENADFDVARDGDPLWPAVLERQAVLALRDLRDRLISLARATGAAETSS
jgi:hypothetical protein